MLAMSAFGTKRTSLVEDPSTAATIYAGTDKVYKSTNQGTTWADVSGTLAGISQFTVLKVAQSDPKVMYAGVDSTVVAVIPRKFPKEQTTQGSASGQTHDPASQGDEAETNKKT